MVGNERPSAPRLRMARSMSQAICRSVMPGRIPAATVSTASSAISIALMSVSSSAASFTARSWSAMSLVGTSSGAGSSACSFSVSALWAATVTDSSSMPMLLAPEAETTSENQS